MAPPPPRPPPFGAAPQSSQKDVQALLLKQRASKRRPGEVPYPLDYSPQMINFDNWDQMFLQSLNGGLTVHQFDTPPQFVLDLGCGSGYWAMEAAKQWPNAQIVGFDLKAIQPELLALDASYMRSLEDAGFAPEPLPIANDIANRVQWVHGNFLDGLPFHSDYFDFIHISGIGLGVPEDEWQFVLEEVSRVMRPDGVLEMIEEDLIFPCVPPRPSRNTLAPLNLNFPPRERKDSAPPSAFSTRSSNTIFSDYSNSPAPESPDDQRVQKKPSLPTLPETGSDSSHRDSLPYEGSLNLEASLSRRETFFPQDMEAVTPDLDHHPEDHTRLKTAWDAMLSRRFLAPSLITVLPFYLSSCFENVQTHHSLQIHLPPGSKGPENESRSSGDSEDADTLFDGNAPSLGGDADMYSIYSKSTRSSQRTIPFWGPMHLAKTVNTVSACKEAIWAEYEQLFPGDLPPVIPNTARPNHRYRPLKHSPREAFETDWTAWEHDMADRITMRGRVTSEFGWAEPEPAPDWRIWRTRMSQQRLGEWPRSTPNDLCRSLRAFVCKPTGPSPL